MKSARFVVGTLAINWSLWAVFLIGIFQLIDYGVSFDDADEILEYMYIAPYILILGVLFLAGGIVMVACYQRAILSGCIASAAIFAAGLVLSLIFGGRADIAAVAFILLLAFSIAGIVVAAIQKHKEKVQVSVQE